MKCKEGRHREPKGEANMDVDTKIKVPLARPTFSNDDINRYLKYVREILRGGRLTLGKYTNLFETLLSEFTGARHAITVSSCTAALHAIMMALKISSSDQVLVPTYTFASTVNAVLFVNAKPILIDSDPYTFNVSVDDVNEKIERGKTKALVAVHIGGNPCNLKDLRDICEDYNIILIEDAAHALGSYFHGKHVGTFGTAAAFSFYPNKIITTGEGGAVITEDGKLAEKIRIIRCVGRKSLGPTEVIELGHNFRMSELQAALGVIQMERLKKILNTRRKIADYYTREFSKVKGIIPQKLLPLARSSYYAYIIRLDPDYIDISRDELREVLLKKYGIETTIIYKPIHLHTFYRRYLRVPIGSLPVAEELGNTTLALPIYGHMTLKEAAYVVYAIKESI